MHTCEVGISKADNDDRHRESGGLERVGDEIQSTVVHIHTTGQHELLPNNFLKG